MLTLRESPRRQYSSTTEASDRLLGVQRRIEPDPDVGGIYEDQRREYVDRWRSVVELY